jgi:hypothetical protein
VETQRKEDKVTNAQRKEDKVTTKQRLLAASLGGGTYPWSGGVFVCVNHGERNGVVPSCVRPRLCRKCKGDTYVLCQVSWMWKWYL